MREEERDDGDSVAAAGPGQRFPSRSEDLASIQSEQRREGHYTTLTVMSGHRSLLLLHLTSCWQCSRRLSPVSG